MADRAALLLVAVCAVSTAAAATEIKPSRPFADAYRSGQDHFYLGQYREALASFQRARGFEPKLPGPHRWLGRTARALKRWDDCIASSTEALRLRPDSPLFSQVKDDIDACRAALGRPTYGKRLTPGQGALAVLVNAEGANVVIDGIGHGPTPLAPLPLNAGRHQIVVDSRSGGRSEATIVVVPGIVVDAILHISTSPP